MNPLRIYASDFKKRGVPDYVRGIQLMINYAIPSMGAIQLATLKEGFEKVYEVFMSLVFYQEILKLQL